MAGVKGRSGGRNAKTVQQHLTQNTFQPVRHAGFTNPDPPKGVPTSPKELAGDALAEWDRMVERLKLTGAISTVDDAAIYQYAQMFSETEALAGARDEVQGAVDRLTESLSDFQGVELLAAYQELTKMLKLVSGYTSQIQRGRMACRVLLVEFGLTPASRGRVKLNEEKEPANPLARFVKRAS